MSNYEFRTLLLCAFRYALGRMSYIPSDVSEIMYKYRDQISSSDLELFIREINEAEERDGLGMDIDKQLWKNTRKFLQEELDSRTDKH